LIKGRNAHKALICKQEVSQEATLNSTMRPTTKDLAKIAGVSRATVDRVLNGRDGVRQDTVDRVNTAIRELGFVRNLQAANLARSKSYRFVFALPRSGDQFLQQIVQRIEEAQTLFAAEQVWCDVQHIDENDPHSISTYLSSLSQGQVTGVAIMSPETPQVRDAIARLQQRGVAALPFISNQTMMDADWVGIDNRAAGATAALLMGQWIGPRRGAVMVIAESMQSRDSLERRLGFDGELNASFPQLRALPSLETYGNDDRAGQIIAATLHNNPDLAGIYVLASEGAHTGVDRRGAVGRPFGGQDRPRAHTLHRGRPAPPHTRRGDRSGPGPSGAQRHPPPQGDRGQARDSWLAGADPGGDPFAHQPVTDQAGTRLRKPRPR
jgi:LacI family transcriptional regulator